jgi:hypothetical protein
MGTDTSQIALATSKGFDLSRESQRVLQDFPHLRDNTVFAVADVLNYNHKKPELYGSAEELLKVSNSPDLMHRTKTAIDYSIDNKTSTAFTFRSPETEEVFHRVIAMNPHQKFGVGYNVDTISTFEHEAGHAVTPTGLHSRFKEASADAFSALRMIQREGDSAIESLSHTSATRAHDFITKDNPFSFYLTTPVIDKIIEDNKKYDFKSLSPDETARFATRYAQENFPTNKEIYHAMDDGDRFLKKILPALSDPNQHKNIPDLLSSTILSTPHQLSFQVGAGFMQPYLSADGFQIGLDWENKAPLPETIRQDIQTRIQERAQHFGLESRFETDTVPVQKTAAPSKFIDTPVNDAVKELEVKRDKLVRESVTETGSAGVSKRKSANKAEATLRIATDLANRDYGGAASTAVQQAVFSPDTWKEIAALSKEIAPIAKVTGGIVKRLPVIGAVVTTGFVAYEVGDNLLDGKIGKAGSALVAGGAEAVGNLVGFGGGDAARESVRETIHYTAGSKYMPQESGLRSLGTNAYEAGSKFFTDKTEKEPAMPLKQKTNSPLSPKF